MARIANSVKFLASFSPEYFFIATALVFGLVLVILVPPFQGGDEPLHFYRAYQISTLNLVVDRNAGNDSGGNIPTSLSRTVSLTTNNSQLGNLKPSEQYHLSTTAQAWSIREEPHNLQWTNFTATALYSPVAYIPQATGVLIARLAGGPPLLMLYFGRTFNLLAWIALFGFAIHLIPGRKWAIAFIGLLPVALSQAASMSADVMTIGLTAVFLAAVLYFARSRRAMTRMELGGLALLMVSMVLCKQIMIVLLPLALLVPKTAFKTKTSSYVLKGSLVTVALAAYGAWLYVIRNVDLKSVFSHNQNPPAQISLMIHSPLVFIGALSTTYFTTVGDSISRSVIGTFGWGDVSLNEFVVTLGYIALFLVLAVEYKKENEVSTLSRNQRLLVGLTVLAYIVAVSASLYAYYNRVGSAQISGLQGRYFLPVLLLAVPLLDGGWLRSSRSAYRAIAIVSPLALLCASAIALYSRYYIG